jgi:hypothetical protein
MNRQDGNWWRKTRSQIKQNSSAFTEEERETYQLAQLKRAARRVVALASHCERCQAYKHEITRLTEELHHLPKSKAQRVHQLETLQSLTRHLRKAHDLVTKRHLIIRGLNYGALLGMGAGLGLDLFIFQNGVALVLGMFIGLTLGFIVGRRQVNQAEEDGRLL